MTRRYELRARAERQRETRQRIIEATVELHRTVGPARTEISEIAARAGVERVTVYRHFPTQSELLAACSEHFRALHPPPDLGPLAHIADAGARLSAGLDGAYAYYERNEDMMASVLRDSAVMPVGGGFLAFQSRLAGILTAGWGLRGQRRRLLHAATRTAVDFSTWRLLTREAGVSRRDAVEMMTRFVAGVADGVSRAGPAPRA